MPKVFVSYSHDSDAHKARVAAFVARLRGEGIVVVHDDDVQKVGGPDEGWPRWCERQIVECDYVLACCTPLFHQRFDEVQAATGGRGVAWEAYSIRQYLYDNPNANRKVRPLVFEDGDCDHIPNALRAFSHFLPSQERSFADLLGWLRSTVSVAPGPSAAVAWAPLAADFPRRLADRVEEFERVMNMLAGRVTQRILLVQGPSGSGKTALIHECLAYAQHCGLPYSHVDFKGAPPLDNVFETLVADLGAATLPKACTCQASARMHAVIADLQPLRKPLFLAFDTYEDAGQTSQTWIEMLLSRFGRCPALVIAVAGRTVPEHSGRSWAPLAHAVALPPIQRVDDWVDFVGRSYGSTGVNRDHVEALTVAMQGNPGQVSAMIDVLVRGLPAT